MLFNYDRSCQVQQRRREHPDDICSAFYLFIDPLERIGGTDLTPIKLRGSSKPQQVFFGFMFHRFDLGQFSAQHRGNDIKLFINMDLVTTQTIPAQGWVKPPELMTA